MSVLAFVLSFLPPLYFLFVVRRTLRTFPALKTLSVQQSVTTSALFLPAIGVHFLTGDYILAGMQIFIAAAILIVGVVAHRATQSGATDDATAADPHTK
ncbi:hypothetical protein ACPXCO_37205 [Streptomyces cyaneofuscatus]|uniref:hypothetical protein n=1 Tax=Streptomyces cyaneofuscatus TaxID=66883 RepID=UPI003CEB8281